MKSNRVIQILKRYKISTNTLFKFLRTINIDTSSITVSTILPNDTCQLIEEFFEQHDKNIYNKQSIETPEPHSQHIEECDINKNNQQITPSIIKGSQLHLTLEWKHVLFEDKKIVLIYNGFKYYISHPLSKTIFNTIIKSFSKRLPPLRIEIHNSTAKLIEPIVLNSVIEILQFQENIFHITKDTKSVNKISISGISKLSKHFANVLCNINKTEYLEYLQDIQYKDKAIIPIYEGRSTTPNGFIFTTKYNEQYFLIWENVEQASCKASYVFQATYDNLTLLQQLIFDYTFSNISCKRELLRNKRVKEFLGFDYFYVDHNNFQSWKKILLKQIDHTYKSGVIKKK